MSTASPQTHLTCLANGLRIVSETLPGAQTVALGLWLGVGTRDEADNANGAAHLVEHMLFKGTPRRDYFAISAEIENGGGYLNAYTSHEITAYHARVLPEHMATAVDVLSDMLLNSLFDDKELEQERNVILQELGRSEDTPDDLVWDLAQEACFANQRLGRPVLGRREVIAGLPRNALLDYWRHYHGGTMVLAAAGRVDHTALVALAEQHLAALPTGTAPVREAAHFTPGQTRRDPRQHFEQTHYVINLPGVSSSDPAYYALQVATEILGGGMSSRLFQEVREKRGLVYSVSASASSLTDSGSVSIYGGMDPQRLPEFDKVVMGELAKLPDTLTEGEVQRARAQLSMSLASNLESPMGRADLLARQLLTFGRVIPSQEMLAQVAAVDLPAARAAAAHMLSAPRSIASVGLRLQES